MAENPSRSRRTRATSAISGATSKKESDAVGRSLAQDRRKCAKAQAKPGQGDRGDRPRA